jgi:hypothetical protein
MGRERHCDLLYRVPSILATSILSPQAAKIREPPAPAYKCDPGAPTATPEIGLVAKFKHSSRPR